MEKFVDKYSALRGCVEQHCDPAVAENILRGVRELIGEVFIASEEASLAHVLGAAGGCGPRAFTEARALDTFQVLEAAATIAREEIEIARAGRATIIDTSESVIDLRPHWKRPS
ncbi:MAG: hypothetical protein WCV62_06210 [Candidatus Peribacteraceae bacterium]|jgi:hypothetical protein